MKSSRSAKPKAAAKKSAARPASTKGVKSKSATVHRVSGQEASAALAVEQVRFTHPEKVLYPEQGLTKLQLAAYYMEVAPWMLPHLEDRPLSLVRCPEGRDKACFYQKHIDPAAAGALGIVPIQEGKKKSQYAVANDLAGLLSLVQMGVLEIHPWGSRRDALEQPDRLIFDIDPGPNVDWSRVVEAAHLVRKKLISLDLESFVKTTGGKGIHVVAPIDRRSTWEELKTFAKAFVVRLAADRPKEFLTTASKAARDGRIYLDYLRNSRGATAVAPYSTRSRPGATVSAPLEWKELTEKLRPDQFNVTSMLERVEKLREDPWKPIFGVKQRLTESMLRSL
jgi:bifunctional non-homologous end joining protein LigD